MILEDIELALGDKCSFCTGKRAFVHDWCTRCGGSGLEATTVRRSPTDSWPKIYISYPQVDNRRPPPYLTYTLVP